MSSSAFLYCRHINEFECIIKWNVCIFFLLSFVVICRLSWRQTNGNRQRNQNGKINAIQCISCVCHNVYMTLTKSIACIITLACWFASSFSLLFFQKSLITLLNTTIQKYICHKCWVLVHYFGLSTRIIHNKNQIDSSKRAIARRKTARAKRSVVGLMPDQKKKKKKQGAKTINQSVNSKDFRVEITLP